MGFLDKRDRIVDVALTERGRRQYAAGELRFVYFAVFDDEVDYDPFYTGTFTDAERELQVEATPVLEAQYVRRAYAPMDTLEPRYNVFTAKPGYTVQPVMVSPTGSDSYLLQCTQASGSTGKFVRSATNFVSIAPKVQGDVESAHPGYTVRLFLSSSAGLNELLHRYDLQVRRSFDPFVAVKVDRETSPSPTTADGSRKGRPV